MGPVKRRVAEADASATPPITPHTLPPAAARLRRPHAGAGGPARRGPRSSGRRPAHGPPGHGGIGKTALALAIAHEWAPHYPDAQLFLDARGLDAVPPSPEQLMALVLQAFRPSDALPEDPAALRGAFRSVAAREARAPCHRQCSRRSAGGTPAAPPGCALIVTSRQSFVLGTQRLITVNRLADADAASLLRMFYAPLTDADAAALVRLCAGLPLALRIAGAHLAMDAGDPGVGGAAAVASYIAALEAGRLGQLDAEALEVATDLATISATLRLSEDRLTSEERVAWRSLSVFTTSFDARAAAAVAGAGDAVVEEVRPYEACWSEWESLDTASTISPLSTLASASSRDDATLRALHLAHAVHYTAIGKEADALYLRGDVTAGLALFDCERAHIDAAYSWLDSCGDDEATSRQLVSLVGAITYVSDLRFHAREQGDSHSPTSAPSCPRAARSPSRRPRTGQPRPCIL